jgi:hypothetical protein
VYAFFSVSCPPYEVNNFARDEGQSSSAPAGIDFLAFNQDSTRTEASFHKEIVNIMWGVF